MKILSTVNPRFPGQRESTQGESGAKARPKGVVDAQQVNIPALSFTLMRGRFLKFPAFYGYNVVGILVSGRKIHQTGFNPELECYRKSARKSGQGERPESQEKPLKICKRDPYRKPTQVDGHEMCQGVRENHRLGTRQSSGRNFGIRPGCSREGVTRSERLQPTVYQKHRSLLNRKVMYRG